MRERFDAAGVIVRSSNYTLYGDMSARVMRVLADFTPELEIYSIDEAFLGLGGFEHAARGACARAARARAAMDRHSGVGRHRADQDARQGGQPSRQERPGTGGRVRDARRGGDRCRARRACRSPTSGASPAGWRAADGDRHHHAACTQAAPMPRFIRERFSVVA